MSLFIKHSLNTLEEGTHEIQDNSAVISKSSTPCTFSRGPGIKIIIQTQLAQHNFIVISPDKNQQELISVSQDIREGFSANQNTSIYTECEIQYIGKIHK